jgi:hypothetical protein
MKRLGLLFLCTLAILGIGFTAYFTLANKHDSHPIATATAAEPNIDSDNDSVDNATVSFGEWMMPVDRFPNLNPIAANHHELIPRVAKIKAGGTVNFIVAGFHHILVYDDGTRPEQINVNMTVPPTNGGPPLINDPNRRLYRGLDPSLFPQDRVEVVHFDEPGTYLVICGVRPHFVNDNMYGFVRVTRNRGGHGGNEDLHR